MIEPLTHEELSVLFVQLAVILAVARSLGRVAERAGFPPVVGELLTGIVLGPSLLGAVAPAVFLAVFPQDQLQYHLLEVVSWLGLVLLLVLTGLETDANLIRRNARDAVTIAAAGITIPFVLGFAFGMGLPDRFLADPTRRLTFALFVATAMSISAIPVIARIFLDIGVLHREFGQVTLAAAMINDTIGWILLSVVIGIAGGDAFDLGEAAVLAGVVLGFLVVSFTVGQWATDRLLEAPGDGPGHERRTISMLAVLALGAGAVTQYLGMEVVLGAFVVGVLANRTRKVTDRTIRTFEAVTLGVFAPVFFATAGLRVDLSALLDPAIAAVTIVALLIAIVGKFVGTYVGAIGAGRTRWEAIGMGAGLNARGALEIIVATVGLGLGVLTTELYTAIVVIAIVTSLMAGPLVRWAIARDEADSSANDAAVRAEADP